jgi:hypothetical protein
MFRNLRHPVLYLIVDGAGAVGDVESFVKACQRQGWDVWVVAAPARVASIDRDVLAVLTGHPVHVDDLFSDDPGGLPRSGALAVVPAAFDTIVKLAYGNTDSLALRLVAEAIGLGLPILAMPAPRRAAGQAPRVRREHRSAPHVGAVGPPPPGHARVGRCRRRRAGRSAPVAGRRGAARPVGSPTRTRSRRTATEPPAMSERANQVQSAPTPEVAAR